MTRADTNRDGTVCRFVIRRTRDDAPLPPYNKRTARRLADYERGRFPAQKEPDRLLEGLVVVGCHYCEGQGVVSFRNPGQRESWDMCYGCFGLGYLSLPDGYHFSEKKRSIRRRRERGANGER